MSAVHFSTYAIHFFVRCLSGLIPKLTRWYFLCHSHCLLLLSILFIFFFTLFASRVHVFLYDESDFFCHRDHILLPQSIHSIRKCKKLNRGKFARNKAFITHTPTEKEREREKSWADYFCLWRNYWIWVAGGYFNIFARYYIQRPSNDFLLLSSCQVSRNKNRSFYFFRCPIRNELRLCNCFFL